MLLQTVLAPEYAVDHQRIQTNLAVTRDIRARFGRMCVKGVRSRHTDPPPDRRHPVEPYRSPGALGCRHLRRYDRFEPAFEVEDRP